MSTKAILLINMNDSRCFNCWQGADYDEKSHKTVLGYGPERDGCGILFEYVSSEYYGKDMEERVKELRPDLPFISVKELPRD